MKYRKGNLEVEAVQFVPTAPIPDWVVRAVKPWSAAGYQPRDGSWGYVEIASGKKIHVWAGNWVVTFPDGQQGVYEDSAFQCMYKPLQGEETSATVQYVDVSVNEVSLISVVQDLQKRVAELESYVKDLRYEDIYQETMKRMNRDLRLKTGAKDRA